MGDIPKHLSYSHLHLAVCPYASFLRYEHGLKGETTPWLALGNAMHYSLENTHKAGPFDLKFAINEFNSEYQRIIADDEVFIGYPLLVKLKNEGVEMLERYDSQIKSGQIPDKPLALEVRFSIPYGGTNLEGKIDKIELDEDGEYTVVDYKSGKSKPKEWDLRNNLQLTAYYWACFELYGKYPKSVVWHHLRTGELLSSDRIPRDIDNLKEMINNIIFFKQNNIRHRVFHEGVCNFCSYKDKECTDYELEKRLIGDGV